MGIFSATPHTPQPPNVPLLARTWCPSPAQLLVPIMGAHTLAGHMMEKEGQDGSKLEPTLPAGCGVELLGHKHPPKTNAQDLHVGEGDALQPELPCSPVLHQPVNGLGRVDGGSRRLSGQGCHSAQHCRIPQDQEDRENHTTCQCVSEGKGLSHMSLIPEGPRGLPLRTRKRCRVTFRPDNQRKEGVSAYVTVGGSR